MPESTDIQVLHIDDEPDFVELAADMLEREDSRFFVETATSPSDGLDRLAAGDFDCVVSDYDMPGKNGIEFLETLQEQYPDLPFILYTGKGSEEVASDALSAGATDYLKKQSGTDQYELLANRIQNAVKQSRAQQRAAELERIRTLVNEINQTHVRVDSRSAAEARVCEIISESDPYLFAWVGEVDSETDRVEPRAWAGVERDYLDEITVTTDDTPTGRGPVGTAIQERRVAISQNVQEDPEFEPWREAALERGYQAVAAVPLKYKDTLYGTLAVYSGRPNAFSEEERELLAELGDDLGHAIHGFAVQRNLERFKNAVEYSGYAIYVTDTDGTIEYVNPAFETITGYTADEALGRNPRIFKSGELSDGYYEELWETLLDGAVWEEEVTNRRKNGELYYAHQTIAPILDEDDDIGAFVAIQVDITEQKEREQELRDLKDRFKTLFEKAPEEIAIHDTNGDILAVNQQEIEKLGYSRDDLTSMHVADFQAEYSRDELQKLWDGMGAGETKRVEGKHEQKDGSTYPVAVWMNKIGISGTQRILAFVRDITERKEREKKLQRYQYAYESSLNGVAIAGLDGELQNVNPAFLDLAGYDDRDEVIGQPMTDVLWKHPEQAAKALETVEQKGCWEDEVEAVRPDGTTFSTRVVASYVTNDDGEPIGILSAFSDNSEQKEREQQLRREKERLDEFARVVSHDLRNPLHIAQARIELAEEKCDTEHLDAAARGVEQGLDLLEDLLELARAGQEISETEPVVVSDLADTCLNAVDTADTTVVVDLTSALRADRTRLCQLLDNLFRNAVEHGGEDVTVRIGSLPEGFYVEDDGPGIPEDEREDIWEAGYSKTKDGTGFGLSIVYEVVEAHDWNIRITESSDGGARFEITGVEVIAD